MFKLFVTQAVGARNLEGSREMPVTGEENVPVTAFEMAGPVNSQLSLLFYKAAKTY